MLFGEEGVNLRLGCGILADRKFLLYPFPWVFGYDSLTSQFTLRPRQQLSGRRAPTLFFRARPRIKYRPLQHERLSTVKNVMRKGAEYNHTRAIYDNSLADVCREIYELREAGLIWKVECCMWGSKLDQVCVLTDCKLD